MGIPVSLAAERLATRLVQTATRIRTRDPTVTDTVSSNRLPQGVERHPAGPRRSAVWKRIAEKPDETDVGNQHADYHAGSHAEHNMRRCGRQQ